MTRGLFPIRGREMPGGLPGLQSTGQARDAAPFGQAKPLQTLCVPPQGLL